MKDIFLLLMAYLPILIAVLILLFVLGIMVVQAPLGTLGGLFVIWLAWGVTYLDGRINVKKN